MLVIYLTFDVKYFEYIKYTILCYHIHMYIYNTYKIIVTININLAKNKFNYF